MEALLARFWKSRSRWGSIAMAGLLCLHLAGCGGAENGSAPVVPSAGTVTGQVVSLATSTPVSGATAKVLADGQIQVDYTNLPRFIGNDTLRYEVCDMSGNCAYRLPERTSGGVTCGA